MMNIDPYLIGRLVEARRSDLLREAEASRMVRRRATPLTRWLATLRQVVKARRAPRLPSVTVPPVVSALTRRQQGEVGEDRAVLVG